MHDRDAPIKKKTRQLEPAEVAENPLQTRWDCVLYSFLRKMVEHEFKHLLPLVLINFRLLTLGRRFISADDDDEVSFRMRDGKLNSVTFRRRGGNLMATGAFENRFPFFALARAH